MADTDSAPTKAGDFAPRIVAFLCNWCSYAGADLAGISRIQYPPSIRVVRVPCSGRVDPFYILKALQQGADGVLVSGCHPGDCHYLTGNYVARRRFAVLHDLLDFFGIEPGRVAFSWVSAAEGERFAEVVREVTEQVRKLGPSNRLAAAREKPGRFPKKRDTSPFPANPASNESPPGLDAAEHSQGTPPVSGDREVSQVSAVEKQLRARARELLEKQEVIGVLGFRQGTLPGTCVPFLATRPDDAGRLVLNRNCAANLAAYLPKLKRRGRIVVIARGPDSRSIVNLVKENQLERDKLHIIGVADPDDTQPVRNPVVFDEFVGERAPDTAPDDYAGKKRDTSPFPANPASSEGPPGLDAAGHSTGTPPVNGNREVSQFFSLPPAERWQAMLDELSRCIRCYACRQVCPSCYCPTCFVDASRPAWVGRTSDPSDNVLFHLVRAMHMAGRCVECGACARACPVGIPLMTINRKVGLIVRERFGHVSGIDPEEPLPMTAFVPEDKEEFIR